MKRWPICKPEGELSSEPDHVGTLIWLPASRTESNKCQLSPPVCEFCYGSPSRLRKRDALKEKWSPSGHIYMSYWDKGVQRSQQPKEQGKMSQAGKTSLPRGGMTGRAMWTSELEAGNLLLQGSKCREVRDGKTGEGIKKYKLPVNKIVMGM